jgi:hypothetical protein
MSVWGKMGKEYYTWYIENMDELEEFIIRHDIDVDRARLDAVFGSDKQWCSLRHQVTHQDAGAVDGIMYLNLVSYNDSTRFLFCKAIKAVVF